MEALYDVTIEYFTDILCIRAWGGQLCSDQYKQESGSDTQLRYCFISFSTGAHLMLKAVQLLNGRGEISDQPDPAFGGDSCFEKYYITGVLLHA